MPAIKSFFTKTPPVVLEHFFDNLEYFHINLSGENNVEVTVLGDDGCEIKGLQGTLVLDVIEVK